jgi:hypothetical protein
MKFVRENTTIPVPRVHETTPTSITMDYVEGTILKEAWPTLSEPQQATVMSELRDYLAQLRAIKGSYIGGIDKTGPAFEVRFSAESGGPFDTQAEYNSFLLTQLPDSCPTAIRDMISRQMRTDHEIVLTHGDLLAHSILVRQGHVVAVLDWEYAGFYPKYHEFMRVLRCPDWKVGYYNAVLDVFPRRYEAECSLIVSLMAGRGGDCDGVASCLYSFLAEDGDAHLGMHNERRGRGWLYYLCFGSQFQGHISPCQVKEKTPRPLMRHAHSFPCPNP